MKRFIVPARWVVLIQGTNLWAKGGKEAAGAPVVNAVTGGIFVALPGVPDSL